ncbi:protein kinase [Lutibacter sp. B2]|nr:protein kinase [Lutibacter sp. B2]
MGIDRLYCGEKVVGRWNKNIYEVTDLLGTGGIARVYKVRDQGGDIWALKVSEDIHSITKEYQKLEKFKSSGWSPFVKELDDYIRGNGKVHFIVMEYIDGVNLKEYVDKNTISIKCIVGVAVIIGKCFNTLHEEGLVFGDLKLENIMVDKRNSKIKMIDLGGVTQMGVSIKEFTPLYDRASFNMGLRRADEKYDLFSLSMLIIVLILRKKNINVVYNVDKLVQILKDINISDEFIKVIHKGLMQKEKSFASFLDKLEKIYQNDHYKYSKGYFDKLELAINGLLVGSAMLFCGVLYKYFF